MRSILGKDWFACSENELTRIRASSPGDSRLRKLAASLRPSIVPLKKSTVGPGRDADGGRATSSNLRRNARDSLRGATQCASAGGIDATPGKPLIAGPHDGR